MGVSFPLGRKQPGCIEMAIYAKYILPRLIDFAMKNKEATRLRAAWIPHARGKVLEVGIGSGLNLPYYSREVQHVYGVDPSPELQQMARCRVISGSPSVEFFSQSSEDPWPSPIRASIRWC